MKEFLLHHLRAVTTAFPRKKQRPSSPPDMQTRKFHRPDDSVAVIFRRVLDQFDNTGNPLGGLSPTEQAGQFQTIYRIKDDAGQLGQEQTGQQDQDRPTDQCVGPQPAQDRPHDEISAEKM
jgi:hypothetical protein